MSVHPAGTTRRNPTVSVSFAAVAACACAVLLAACGGSGTTSSGATSAPASASPTPTPVPSPVITSGDIPAAAIDVIRAFWTQVGEGDIQEAREYTIAPGSSLLDWTGDDIAAAKLVRVLPDGGAQPGDGATMTFAVDVWIKPSGITPWGKTGLHTVYVSIVRMSDGSWRMWAVNTGP